MNDRAFTLSKIKSNTFQMAGAVLKGRTAPFVLAIGMVGVVALFPKRRKRGYCFWGLLVTY